MLDLLEAEGLTAEMVRAWLRSNGWAAQSQRPLAWWTPPKDAPHRVCGIWLADEGSQSHPLDGALRVVAWAHGLSLQSLLAQINPRMRAGWPTAEERARHHGPWLGHLGGKFPSVFIGYFVDGDDGPEFKVGPWFWDKAKIDAAAQSEYPCAFWPCDAHGNKVRRGTR